MRGYSFLEKIFPKMAKNHLIDNTNSKILKQTYILGLETSCGFKMTIPIFCHPSNHWSIRDVRAGAIFVKVLQGFQKAKCMCQV
jgi:hypothetical protein